MKIDDAPSGTDNELVTINAAGLLGKRSVGSLPGGGGGDGIYGGSGILTTDTIVAGNAFDFRISNVTTMRVGADDVILLQPPTVVNTETNLLVRDSATGEVHIREVSSLPGSADTNIYNSNGVITGGDRVLDGNGNSLAFDNVDVFNISATTVTLGTSPPDDPSVVRLLTYDALSDEVRTRLVSSLPGGGGDGNIYDNNGVLGGNRIVDGDNNTLSFTNLTECDIDSDIIRITPLPPTNNSLPQVLSRNPIGGRLEMVSSSSLPNIYNSNGTISTNRVVGGGGVAGITFNAMDYFNVQADSMVIASPAITIGADPPNGSNTTLLTRNLATGALEGRQVDSLPTLYTTNGLMSSNRVLNGLTNDLAFNNIGTFNISADTVTLGNTPPDDPAAIRLLTYESVSNEVRTRLVSSLPGGAGDGNIYDNNGTLAASRTLTGAGNNLSFNGLGTFTIGASSIVLTNTPGNNSSANVLLVRNPSTNQIQSRLADSLPNIYNQSATLTGNRILSGGGNSLTVQTISTLAIGATAVALTNVPTLDNTATVILMRDVATGQLRTRTVASLPSGGGSVDTLYNNDGTLNSTREVDCDGNDIRFENAGEFKIDALSNIVLSQEPSENSGATNILCRNPSNGNVEVILKQDIIPTPAPSIVSYNPSSGGGGSPDITFTRLGRQATMVLASHIVTGFSEVATSWSLTPATSLPFEFQPSFDQNTVTCFEAPNGTSGYRMVRINFQPSGNIVFTPINGSTAFTGFGTTIRITPQTMTYLVNG